MRRPHRRTRQRAAHRRDQGRNADRLLDDQQPAAANVVRDDLAVGALRLLREPLDECCAVRDLRSRARARCHEARRRTAMGGVGTLGQRGRGARGRSHRAAVGHAGMLACRRVRTAADGSCRYPRQPDTMGTNEATKRAPVHLAPRLRQRLALLVRDEPREVLGVPLALVEPLPKQGAALVRGILRRPVRKGIAGRLDGGADVVGRQVRHAGEDVAGGRIDDRHAGVGPGGRRGADPAAVDPAVLSEQRRIAQRRRPRRRRRGRRRCRATAAVARRRWCQQVPGHHCCRGGDGSSSSRAAWSPRQRHQRTQQRRQHRDHGRR